MKPDTNNNKTILTVFTSLMAIGVTVYACKPGSAENDLNGFSVEELNGAECGGLACKDVAPKYELMVKNIDPAKSDSPEHNAIRVGLFISHDRDAMDRPEGYGSDNIAQGLGGLLPNFDPNLQGSDCKITDNNDLGVRSALKMFSYLTGACAPDLNSLTGKFASHEAGEDKSENKQEGRKFFLKNPSWKNEVKGTSTVMTIWGKGPTMARSSEGVSHFSDENKEDGTEESKTRLETHNYVFDIVVDNAGGSLGKAFGEHLVDPATSMSFFWGHFYPGDAQAAAANQQNTANGGQSVRNYFRSRTSEIYGPMLDAIENGLRQSKKKYMLGFLVGCFSEQIEDALVKAVKDSGTETKFDWVGQRGRHNYLEFPNALHRVLLAMHYGATFAHFDGNGDNGILNAFVFGGSGLENRFSAENQSLRNFFDGIVPDKVIPVLRSNRYATLEQASGDGKAGFTYDEDGNVVTIDENGDAGRN